MFHVKGTNLTTNANTTIIIVAPQSSFSFLGAKHQNQSLSKFFYNVHCVWICWKHLRRVASKVFLQILLKKNVNMISIDIPTIAILKFYHFCEKEIVNAFLI
jgi:hypothetical protein